MLQLHLRQAAFRTANTWAEVVDSCTQPISLAAAPAHKRVMAAGPLTIYCAANACILIVERLDKRVQVVLMSREQLLTIHDISLSRAVASFLTKMSSTQGSLFLPRIEEISKVFEWGDQLIRDVGKRPVARVAPQELEGRG